MRADAESNRRALLDAATQLMAEQGPDVSLRMIARRADVGIATLYRHFPTRTDLEEGILVDLMRKIRDVASRFVDSPGPATVEQWKTFVDQIAQLRIGALVERFSSSADALLRERYSADPADLLVHTPAAKAPEDSDDSDDRAPHFLEERALAIGAVDEALSKAAASGFVDADLSALRFSFGLAVITKPLPNLAQRAIPNQQEWLIDVYLKGLEPRT